MATMAVTASASVQAVGSKPPAFASVDEERRFRKESLAIAFRVFARQAFDLGFAGHITARDPGQPDHFWVNPIAVPFARIRVSDLLLVDSAGEVVVGSRHVNRAAFAIHSAIHRLRPDVTAAAHAHSVHGRAWSTLGRLLDPLTQDACAFYQDHVVYDAYSGVVLDVDEGERMATALGRHKAAILRNHGLLTVGNTVEEAAWWFISFDDCCRVQLLAEAAGDPRPLDDEAASHTAAQVGSKWAAWNMYRPLRNLVSELEPDVFD